MLANIFILKYASSHVRYACIFWPAGDVTLTMCCIGADRDCCAGASSASLHSGIARNSCASHELRIKFHYTTWVQNNDIFVVDVLSEYVYTHKKNTPDAPPDTSTQVGHAVSQ